MNRRLTVTAKLLLLALFTALVPACAGWNPNQRAEAEREAHQAVQEFRKHDPSMKSFFNKAYAYAIFPTVGKGGIGIGGAHGTGLVYRHNKLLGYTTLNQITIGWQLGGQSYREIIFFKNQKAFNKFKNGDLKFSAQADAVAATAGAGAKTSYAEDMAVFTLIKGGLMYEASLGGQTFSFEPLK
jgi:lipid-binding SYLF domain-containing protein